MHNIMFCDLVVVCFIPEFNVVTLFHDRKYFKQNCLAKTLFSYPIFSFWTQI